MNQIITRKFIRHPSEIPLEYCVSSEPPVCNMDFIHNISRGGLSFHSICYIKPQQWLHIYIPVHENYFEADAQVKWCTKRENTTDDDYDIGVSFTNSNTAFCAKMVEQICYIEQYKRQVKHLEGRELSSDQAAAEWISKFADFFPSGM